MPKPSREALLGFAFGVAVILLGFFVDFGPILGWAPIAFILGGWLYFSIRDRREAKSRK
jgi:hypothetical protein